MHIESEELSVQRVVELRNTSFKLVLSDRSEYILSASSLEELDLSYGKFINPAELNQIKSESFYSEIHKKALELLSLREHSQEELKKKLRVRFRNYDIQIERCLKEMQSKQYQSNERFIRSFIVSRLSNRRNGPYRILADLKQRGISNEIAKTFLDEMTDHDYWMKQIHKNLDDFHKKGKKKRSECGQKLYQLGFPFDLIETALNNAGF